MDTLNTAGFVRVIKRDLETGRVIFDELFKNRITNFARQQSALLWTGTVVQTPTMIAVGTGNPPAGQTGTTPNDTALWSELSGTRKTVDAVTAWLSYYSQYTVTYLQNEAIGTVNAQNPTGLITLTEAGLFDASGNLWAHVALNGVTHDNTSSLSIIWQVLHQGN